jgi:hypothetical protein
MFPRLRDRFGAALDTVVEFSTLGEYRLGAFAPAPAGALPADSDRAANDSGWEASPAAAGGDTGAVAARRTVAGGAAALHGDAQGCEAQGRALLGASAATPAARCRLPASRWRDRRSGSATPLEQLCLLEQPPAA